MKTIVTRHPARTAICRSAFCHPADPLRRWLISPQYAHGSHSRSIQSGIEAQPILLQLELQKEISSLDTYDAVRDAAEVGI
ncbi:MAG: hypothetical protein ABI377_03940 [Devosia sp.]